MRKWYAMLDDESFTYIGEHKTFDDADDAAFKQTKRAIWLFDSYGLRKLVENANKLLSEELK